IRQSEVGLLTPLSPREGLCRADAELAARNPKSGHTAYPISTPTQSRQRAGVRSPVGQAAQPLTLPLSRRERGTGEHTRKGCVLLHEGGQAPAPSGPAWYSSCVEESKSRMQ